MRGIEFEIVWLDHSMVECRVTCSNGPFRGATNMYLAHDALPEAAEALSGFPTSAEDTRDVQLGAPDPKFAGGGISLGFRCVDSVGHAVVQVKLRSDGRKGAGAFESVFLYIPVEAGAIDSFVAKARSMNAEKGAKA